jgi:outer membrane receptor protein involved in Fe transport
MKRLFTAVTLLAAIVAGGASSLTAQGVTTSQIRGVITSPAGPLAGAQITALHEPSGSRYTATSRADGRYSIAGMRVGGPYTVSSISIGFERQSRGNVFLTLGQASDVNFSMRESVVTLQDITVAAQAGVFSSTRTGAATTISQEQIATLPTISRSLNDLTRLTPQVRGQNFVGADSRLNNITIDGSYFNNSFGLGSGATPGGRTGVAPVSVDAIEQIQVNIAPFDVRQGNFVGAGINAVTKSGTNDFQGSLYYQYRNESFVGTQAGAVPFNPGTFNFDNIGARFGGPIIKNKLFFFGSYEQDAITEPGTLFTANTGGQTVEGTTTRVEKADLDGLSSFLANNFDYATGPYQGYDHETPSKRYLARLDWNISDRNKFQIRYNKLDSKTDVLASSSSSLGFGNRSNRLDAIAFQNTNYQILENLWSVVGELNSQIGPNMANQVIAGYNTTDESRDTRGGAFFPMVDILKDGRTYTSFGYEPFTPNNELRYNSYQFQNNFTIYGNRHDLTFGVSVERYESENVFFPGSQSAYVYNSLEDFYTDANGFLANPNRTSSPVSLRRFQVRYSNIPGQEKPIQPLEVLYAGLYVQDIWRATDNLEVTIGVRADRPDFGETGFINPQANGYNFRDAEGSAIQYRTEQLPNANVIFSPRLGFNWDVKGDRSTQIRGGTGVFSGRPAYVWISNQIGENGVLTGFEQQDNITSRPFNPDPDKYKPSSVDGSPAASYGLAFTDPDFKFPQVWRTNIAIDQQLPGGWVGTAEFLYGRDINGLSYINANLPANQTAFTGADTRQRWTSDRINGNVTGAFVLGNNSVGRNWNIGASLEKAFNNGFFAKFAYNYGEAKNTVDPGSIASGTWQNNPIDGDPNNPALGFSATSPGHRFFAALAYKRDLFSFGTTGVSVFFEGFTPGNVSYTFSGDANGDRGLNNDLIYVPRDQSEMNFVQYTTGGVTFTPQQQAAAWDAYIEQDDYLSGRRGQYAERNAAFAPMIWRADLSVTQDLFAQTAGKLSNFQVRLDILNFTNMLKSDWGIGQRFVSNQPLTNPGVGANGQLTYRMRSSGGELLTKTFEKTAGFGDVWRMQLGLRYSFK